MSAFLNEADLEDVVLDYLAEEGWETAHGGDIAPGEMHAERDDYRDVVLVKRLRASVVRLNPDLPPDAVDDVVKTVIRPDSQVLMSENWRGYQLLTLGVPVEFREESSGALKTVRARLVDWQDGASNDLLAVNQFTVQGFSERRPDVVLFLNGLPVVVLELKRPGQENATVQGAFNQIRTYVKQIPDLFTWNQVTAISDGYSARAGTFTAPWEHFAPWKTIHGDLESTMVPQLEVLIRGMLNPTVLLDLIQNFVVFAGDAGTFQK